MTTNINIETFSEYNEDITTPITSFMDKWYFLSNFSPAEVEYENMKFPTVEHAYQAAKTLDIPTRQKIQNLSTPNEAKVVGKTIELRPNWSKIKLRIMEDLLRQKFKEYTDNYFKLLQTFNRDLIECNTWRDTYWGVYHGVGKNHLGKLLVKIRNEKLIKSFQRLIKLYFINNKKQIKSFLVLINLYILLTTTTKTI